VFDPFFNSIKHTRQEKKKKLSSTVTLVLVDETDARQNVSVNSKTSTKTGTSTVLNPTRIKETTSTMLLHNNSLKYIHDFVFQIFLLYLFIFLFSCNNNNNKHKNGEAFSYDFIQSNSNHHSSSLLKTSPTLEKKGTEIFEKNIFYTSYQQ